MPRYDIDLKHVIGLVEYIGGAIQSIFRGSRHPPSYMHTGPTFKLGKSHAKSEGLLVAAGMGLVGHMGQPLVMNMDTYLLNKEAPTIII